MTPVDADESAQGPKTADNPMQLLVFAHTPPPHHGQSYMVQLMLNELGERRWEASNIICHHVDCRISRELDEVGRFQWRKMRLLFCYVLAALTLRLRRGRMIFYYVPAQPTRIALYRDWIVMALCRPFFREMVFHWHAGGLSEWLLSKGMLWERWITRLLMGSPSLSIVLGNSIANDAKWLASRRIAVVPNGIADPCPNFAEDLLPRRRVRVAARQKLLGGNKLTPAERSAAGPGADVFRVLFLAHAMREKGIFDALEATAIANAHLQTVASPLRVHLTVAGRFTNSADECDFNVRVRMDDLRSAVTVAGFVSGHAKSELLNNSDCLCLPSYYRAESLPVAIVEALGVGMNIIATDWRAIPELLPIDWPGLVPVRNPEQIAQKLLQFLTFDRSAKLRAHYLSGFTAQQHVDCLVRAFRGVADSVA